ncbi:MAG TPA: ATP-binding protein [Sulfolobales archaeon]|nr:ATP-binding protein [Sulfolobales archaeon]
MEILRGAKSSKVNIEGWLVNFVDREGEIERIVRSGATGEIIGYGTLALLYGPKGCGKSTLASVLTKVSIQLTPASETGFKPIYVAYDEQRSVVSITSSKDVIDIVREVYGRAGLEVGVSVTAAQVLTLSAYVRTERGGNPHASIASDIISILEHRGRVGSWYLVILDEYRVTDPQRLADFLYVRQTDISMTNLRLYEGGRDIVIDMIVTTSDARAAETRGIVGGKIRWLLTWNLPREAADILIDQLGIGENRELLWRLAGGNPRALGLIRRSGLKIWLMSEVIEGVLRALDGAFEEAKRLGRDRSWVMDQVRAVAENPDALFGEPLRDHLITNNIAIYVAAMERLTELPKESWVGRVYAFQIPAYYYTLRAIAKKNSLEVSINDVVREAS